MQHLTAVVTATILFVAPATAQETQQVDTVYRSAAIPVWIAVRDAKDDPGVHWVWIEVTWDDAEYKEHFWFAKDVEAGDFVVRLPKNKDDGDDDLASGCAFKSNRIEHGSRGASSATREDVTCLALLVADMPFIGVKYRGSSMACTEATRKDGETKPWIRYFGCYWAKKPQG